jgi:triacylglycerol lipase
MVRKSMIRIDLFNKTPRAAVVMLRAVKDLAPRIFARYLALAAAVALPRASLAASAHDIRRRNPVLLIHGLSDSANSMRIMKSRLERGGWHVFALSLRPSDGSARLEDLAEQLARYVDATFRRRDKIDMVAFSMGGLVGRYYLQRLGGAARVERFVSISAPNRGSWLAYLSRKPGCRQMRPGSEFLTALNRDLTPLGSVQCLSIWTPLDMMIIPSSSSRLKIGEEATNWAPAHPLMILQGRVFETIARFLGRRDA